MEESRRAGNTGDGDEKHDARRQASSHAEQHG